MIKHSSSSVSVAVSAASHTLSDLKLMRLYVVVAECATEQTLHHLHHFVPFLFMHFTCDAPAMASCSLQSGDAVGAELGVAGSLCTGGSRVQLMEQPKSQETGCKCELSAAVCRLSLRSQDIK